MENSCQPAGQGPASPRSQGGKKQLVRESVGAMLPVKYPPSSADAQAMGITGNLRRLHLNESAFPPSPKVLEAMAEACKSSHLYPDPKATALTSALAEKLEIPAEEIIIGNGSDQLLQTVTELFLDHTRSAILPEPSFPTYLKAVQSIGAEAINVPLRADGANNIQPMISAITPSTRVMFVATPNNPTGAMLMEGELKELAEGVPDDVLVVLDEAYFEFAKHSGGPDGLRILKDHRKGPWIVLRTFSKAYAIAGLRIGYACCSSEAVAEAFRKVMPIFSVNIIAQAAALAALQDQAYSEQIVRETSRERQRLAEGLRGLGIQTLPSQANFVTAKLEGDALPTIKALAKRGIFITGVRSPLKGFEGSIRITVGSKEDTDAVVAALKEELRL